MNKKIRTEAVDHLFQAILTLKDAEECYTFFEDVCTVNELLSLSQRYEAVSYTHLAQWLFPDRQSDEQLFETSSYYFSYATSSPI